MAGFRKLTNAEWQELGGILGEGPDASPNSRERHAADVCLYRFYHSLGEHYRSFGWNDLPKPSGVSPATANRRFREWTESGVWFEFWQALGRLRRKASSLRPLESPVVPIIRELERAFAFFNDAVFDNALPTGVSITLERSSKFLGQFCAILGGTTFGIAISTRTLNQGAEIPLHALLHEMVHLRNHCTGIPDVYGRYHNRHFRDTAALAGLDCEHGRLGYAVTKPNHHALGLFAAFRPKLVFVWPFDLPSKRRRRLTPNVKVKVVGFDGHSRG